MNKLKLGKWEERPYGQRATGKVTAGSRDIKVTARRGTTTDGTTLLLANGWTGGKNSMRKPAIEAAKLGRHAITFEYSNTSSKNALQSNVHDVVDIAEALSNDERLALMGLSMGGAVMTLAMKDLGDKVSRAALVAPGKYLRSEYYSARIIAQHLGAEALETRHMYGHPATGIKLLAGSVINCARRPQAVIAEMRELLDGNVHEDLIEVKSKPNAPHVSFFYGDADVLLPAYAQEKSIVGLPFDFVESYVGGHERLVIDPTLAQHIFSLDNQSMAA